MTIGIEHVNDYPLIRFEIRFERKFSIRRSLTFLSARERAREREQQQFFISSVDPCEVFCVDIAPDIQL